VSDRDGFQGYQYVNRVIRPEVHIGELCKLTTQTDGEHVLAEVVGFKDKKTLLMPIAEMNGISPKSEVIATGKPLQIKLGMSLKGRILDGLGSPIDNKGPIDYDEMRTIHNELRNHWTGRSLPTLLVLESGVLTAF